jgi:hypothetical protein
MMAPSSMKCLDVVMKELGVVGFGHRTLLAQLFRILDSAGHGSRQQNVQSGTIPKVLRNGHADQNFVLDKEDCFLRVGLRGHARQRVTATGRSSTQKFFDMSIRRLAS